MSMQLRRESQNSRLLLASVVVAELILHILASDNDADTTLSTVASLSKKIFWFHQ